MRSTVHNLSLSTLALCVFAAFDQQAIAATPYSGWNYAIDSFTDGVAGPVIGGNDYEIYGLAWQETSDRIQVAINTNMPFLGVNNAIAQNGSIALGDLFLNFSGKDFQTASAGGELFAVRFVPTNDSPVGLGVYRNVVAQSVTANNSGFGSLAQYNLAVAAGGGTPSLGDLTTTDPYFATSAPILNAIATGTFVGGISALDPTGLDFGALGATGSQTFGFSFDKSLVPVGNFIANLFEECANDGIALKYTSQSESQSVPEPSLLIGLAATGLIFGATQKRQRL